jgi:hypothetical protein
VNRRYLAKAVRVNRPYLFVIISCTRALPAAPAGSRLSSSFSFKGRISEGIDPQGNFQDLQKTLDAISFFAAKGGSPICVYAHTRREKTN